MNNIFSRDALERLKYIRDNSEKARKNAGFRFL